jgi:hypothetical protein
MAGLQRLIDFQDGGGGHLRKWRYTLPLLCFWTRHDFLACATYFIIIGLETANKSMSLVPYLKQLHAKKGVNSSSRGTQIPIFGDCSFITLKVLLYSSNLIS